jgi:hypothetical protein
MTVWEYCWLHWSSHQVTYLTEAGERHEFPAYKDSAVAVARLGLAGWELVSVYHDMLYFKREKVSADAAVDDPAEDDDSDVPVYDRD